MQHESAASWRRFCEVCSLPFSVFYCHPIYPTPAMHILIVEDEEVMLTSLEFRLKRQGYTVAVARDGREAIEALSGPPVSLIVCDVVMPNMNGLEFVEYLRNELHSRIPVIMISAIENNADVIMQAYEIGAQDFISKPFNPQELVIRIRRLLEGKENTVAA